MVETIRDSSRRHEDDSRRADFSWLAQLTQFNVRVGLRRRELIHLQWEHVNLKYRVLQVANTKEFTTKTVKERTIPLCDVVLEILRELYEEKESSQYVFQLNGGKLNHNTLTHYFRRFRHMAGLPAHFNLHSTRHTFGTLLTMRGVPL